MSGGRAFSLPATVIRTSSCSKTIPRELVLPIRSLAPCPAVAREQALAGAAPELWHRLEQT